MKAALLLSTAVLAFTPILAHAATPPACADKPCAFLDTSLSPEARAKDLVSRMTLEEKAQQMQDNAPAIARLGLPKYGWWNEVLHGLARAGHATVYPQAIGLAATWDPHLMHDVGDAIADEGRASHNAQYAAKGGTDRYFGVNYWSPNINIFRDPRWGRGQETYGEDPYLTGHMAIGFITGIQGDDAKVFKGVATPKHFAVHSGPEATRHKVNIDPSPFDLEDTYLPAFRNAIADAHADSMMCAYNAVDGAPMCENKLLNDRVRDDWGFKGFIVSDCDAVNDEVTGHKSETDEAHASAASIKAGTDLDCGSAYAATPDAVKQGLISEAEVDQSLIRLMTARIRMGLLDGSPYDAIPASDINSPQHRALALKAAEEAIVLLGNAKGVLPLQGSPRIAVIGPNAELLQSIEGNYTGSPIDPSFPLDALKTAFGADHVVYAPGAPLMDGMRQPVPRVFLRPAADSTDQGLKGEYFDNKTFDGAPKVTRTDPVINFDYYHSAPDGLTPMGFSVRWSGVIVPPAPGSYQLGFRMVTPKPGQPQPDVKIWVDGKLVLTPEIVGISDGPVPKCNSGMCAQPGRPVEITFADTKPHDIRIDYVRTTDDRASSLDWIAPDQPLIDGAVAAAKQSDVVVAFVGLSPDLEGEEMAVNYPGFSGGDRTSLALPAAQQKMLEAVKATGKPLVVVYLTGGEISDSWVAKNADAVVQAWYPGEEGGQAIANVLSGKVNPSGRLPYTIYNDVADLPSFESYDMKGRTYRYFRGPVEYAFGHGLSYTSFTYATPSLSKKTVAAGTPVTLSVPVKNAGPRDGDEVVELYIQKPQAPARWALAGFQRVHLKAGDSQTVTLTVDARALSQVDVKGNRKVVPGIYTLYAGGGQPGTAMTVKAALKVTGSVALPK